MHLLYEMVRQQKNLRSLGMMDRVDYSIKSLQIFGHLQEF
jgi:hypothetical protein